MTFRVQGLDHVALGVGDQQASESWYYFRDPDGLRLELTTYEV